MNYPATNTIKKRKSVRTYSDEIIPDQIIQNIINFFSANCQGPCGTKLRYQIVDLDTSKTKLGTYGFISGAKKYLLFYAEKENFNWLDIGYVIENVVLYCAHLGIGTCWLGGTFNRSNLTKNILDENKYFIPAITPVGFARKRKTLREKVIRGFAKAENRIPTDKILVNTPKEKLADSKVLNQLIQMVRLAPSASNKQPWRIEIENNVFHFYMQRTKGYSKIVPGIDLQKIDMGIALCHFCKTLKELNIPMIKKFDAVKNIEGLEYQKSLEIDLSEFER